MKIIISPAKKMNVDTDTLAPEGVPVFLEETEELLAWMRQLSWLEAKELWKCNDRIADQNYQRLQEMDLRKNLTPAVVSYEGIQYQYMAPAVFDESQMKYIREHLRILSGFYGVLRPFDGVVPYRLEMQAKASKEGDLYKFWADKLYQELKKDEEAFLLNLASKEYSRCIEKYLQPGDVFLTCVFAEVENGKVKQKGTYANMARGEMVRYLTENQVENLDEIKSFDRLGYRFDEGLSTESKYVFLKQNLI